MRDRPRPQGALRAGKIAVAVLSVLVVTGAGVAWSQVRNLQDGLTTADVIDPGAASSAGPAEEQNILLVGLDTRTDAQGVPLPQAILDQLRAVASWESGSRNGPPRGTCGPAPRAYYLAAQILAAHSSLRTVVHPDLRSDEVIV